MNADRLVHALASPRLSEGRGLGEPPFYIYPYPPDQALEVERLRRRLPQRLAERGVTALEIDLYDLSVALLEARGVWDQVLAVEPDVGKDELKELLQGMLDPEAYLAPAIERATAQASSFDLLLLSGVGEVYPFIRSATVLNNLQRLAGERPVLLFFPGLFAQGSSGASLELLGRLHDDRYYRATDIRHFQP